MLKEKIHTKNRISSIGRWFSNMLWCILWGVLVCSTPTLKAQCVLVCNNAVNIALDNNGIAHVEADDLLQNMPTACTLEVQVFDGNGLMIGDTVSCAQLGQTLTAHVVNTANGNYCSTTINIMDYIAPEIQCVDRFISCNTAPHPDSIGYPVVFDNCTSLDSTHLDYFDTYTDLNCYTGYNGYVVTGRYDRTWTVTDEAGLTHTCVQQIFLQRVTLSDVQFPDNRDGFDAPKLVCGQDDYNDFSITGEPTVFGKPIDNAGQCELVVTYTDLVVPTCGGGEKVLREWKVVDFCAGNSITDLQILDIADQTAPIINCPSDTLLGTKPYDCAADVTLPTISAFDDCSNVNIVPSWAFGTGYGPFINVPIGTHLVTYTATDDCGNSSVCTMNISIADDDPPAPICEVSLSVSLLPTGMTRIYATTLDEGSFDNCGIDRFEVRRDTFPFGEYVEFDCLDIGNTPVPVDMRVYDINGLYNDCIIQISVHDNIPPTLDCPDDITLNCIDDITNLTLTGQAFAFDNCTLDTLIFSDSTMLNSCGVGTVERTWYTEDVYGLTQTCIQTITIQDTTTLQVSFPLDITIDLCSGDSSISSTGEPIFSGADCRSLAISHTDQNFSTAGACPFIIRDWTVVDWCVYDPNVSPTNGRYEAQQFIYLTDAIAPQLICPVDTIVADSSLTCSGSWINLTPVFATDCDSLLTFTNDSPYAANSGADASGIYPQGIHTITYTATDRCGNIDSCIQIITVEDGIAPSVICLNGVSIPLMANGIITISPNQLNAGSSDNCTNAADLMLSISPDTFTCADVGTQLVTLTATDGAGNSASCSTYVIIQDNAGACTNNSTATIAGEVVDEVGRPVELCDLKLSIGDSAVVATNALGEYEFSNLATGANYEITPTKTVNPSNGVSTYDIVLIQQHILGIEDLNSPYKIIAADVNNSGNVTTFDIVLVRQLVLNIITAFPNVNSWRFIDASFVFPNPADPFLVPFPERHTCTTLSADELQTNFIAIKMGDVNNSVAPNQFAGETEARNQTDVLSIFTTNQVLEKGYTYRVPIQAKDMSFILGFQFGFQFDPNYLALNDISYGTNLYNLNDGNFGLAQVEEGLLSVSWNHALLLETTDTATLFVLEFEAKQSTILEEVFTYSNRAIKGEAYSIDFEVMDIQWQLEEPTEIPSFLLEQNFPNPFITQTRIPFYLEKANKVQFNIYNTQGQLIYQTAAHYPAGKNQFLLDRTNLGTEASLLFYEIQVATHKSQLKKMVLLRD